jgi:hypothetical protein
VVANQEGGDLLARLGSLRHLLDEVVMGIAFVRKARAVAHHGAHAGLALSQRLTEIPDARAKLASVERRVTIERPLAFRRELPRDSRETPAAYRNTARFAR